MGLLLNICTLADNLSLLTVSLLVMLLAPWWFLGAPSSVAADTLEYHKTPEYPHAGSPLPDFSNLSRVVEFGRAIFLDTKLSRDGSVGCVSCHQPDRAFMDGKRVAEGVQGKQGTRNTPSLQIAAFTQAQFWDGRSPSLEQQVLIPIFNPNEHGVRSAEELIAKIRNQPSYEPLVTQAFGIPLQQVQPSHIVQALSAFVRSLKLTDTRLDKYLYTSNLNALTIQERRGLDVFRGRANCTECHLIGSKVAPLTDGNYHSLAVGFDRLASKLAELTGRIATLDTAKLNQLITTDTDIAALGRFCVTLKPTDIGKFKTPSLRNVADTAPYMHDGSVPTLEQAIEREIYYRGKALGRPLILSLTERADLLAFLRGLGSIQPIP